MKRLIVNADDFGLHQAINNGIIRGHKEGFITSASLMCGGEAFGNAVAQAKACPELGIGIHLTLVGGIKPLLPQAEARTITDANGFLASDYSVFAKNWYTGKIKKSEIVAELRLQFEMAFKSGLNITHVDSHQHIHVLPGITDIVLNLCNEFGVKNIRMPQEGWFWKGGYNSSAGRLIGRDGLSFCSALAKMKAKKTGLAFPDHFFGMLAGGNLNEFLVGEIIKKIPDGVSEIMTHPGSDTDNLSKKFLWQYHWEDELDAFLSKKNKALLEEQEITLINFGGL